MNEGLCKVSDFGCCVRGLVSALCLFFAVLTVNVTKKPPASSKNRGCFREKWGAFWEKVWGFGGITFRLSS